MSSTVEGGSRPSKNNCQGHAEGGETPEILDPRDLPGDTGLRPLSVEPGRTLREEAVMESTEGPQARHWYVVVNKWRDWYSDYRTMHAEYLGPEGEVSRIRLENSYQPRYGKRYYAKLKDLERALERVWKGNVVTVLLTFSASTLNAEGLPRCPADHMRQIADGWDTCRKQLYQVLDGANWEYAKVWEPHPGGERSPGGYGHLHVAVFVEADELSPQVFEPVLDSYVQNTKSAGTKAHTVDEAVSVNDNVENLGSYISEYIGAFGDDPLERSMVEQMFFATTWATQTRRVEFSNGAQELISGEKFRRETGLRPEDRGGECRERWKGEGGAEGAESDENLAGVEIDPDGETIERADESGGWEVESICRVEGGEPNYLDPASGGVAVVEIAGQDGVDPPREVD